MHKLIKNQKGVLLITSYLALATLMTMSLALWSRSDNFNRVSEQKMSQMTAFHMAESALDQVIVALEQDLTYTGFSDTNYTFNGQVLGTYSASVETPDNSNPYLKKVVSSATTNDTGGDGRRLATRSTISYVELIPPKNFDFAFFAEEGITFSGSGNVVADSYDSALGPYNGITAYERADVATNSTTNSIVTVSGNATIKGDVSVGEGGDPSTGIDVGPNGSITGGTGSLLNNKVLDPVEVPRSAEDLGNVNLSGKDNLILTQGVYVMDSLNMAGQSTITTQGQVTVYFRGDAKIAGNGVATTEERPRNLIFHVMGNQKIDYAGNADLHAAIYAPDGSVKISGNGQVFGAVVGHDITLNGGGNFHYDEDLKRTDPNDALRAEIVSWQENNKSLG